ncbi:MAG: NAD(P)H-dependent oxidoreductase [Gemmatimonadetes bacterium]|nr:NAD(P)H-dependent oxidoreductase [Gemmatimonadota bacterium]
MPFSRRMLFLLASARRDGNTEQLARVASASLSLAVQQRWLHLDDHPLPPFRDIRHDAGSYPQPSGHERVLADATLEATDLVLATPLYWYSVPASAKLYLDYWSAWMRVPGLDFKARMAGKRMWVVSAYSDEDPAMVQPLIDTLRLCAAYLQMEWGGVLLGYGSRPGDVMRDEGALERAGRFFHAS